jgi:hypothetical protein
VAASDSRGRRGWVSILARRTRVRRRDCDALGGRVHALAAGEAAILEGDGEWAGRLERLADADPDAALLDQARQAELTGRRLALAAWRACARERE